MFQRVIGQGLWCQLGALFTGLWAAQSHPYHRANELLADLTIERSSGAIGNINADRNGAGGDATVVWFMTWNNNLAILTIYKLNPADFSVQTSAVRSMGGGYDGGVTDIGGTKAKAFISDLSLNQVVPVKIREIDVETLADVRTSAGPPGSWFGQGIGGNEETVWFADDDGEGGSYLYKLDYETLALIASGVGYGGGTRGAGGTSTQAWIGTVAGGLEERLAEPPFTIVRMGILAEVGGIGG